MDVERAFAAGHVAAALTAIVVGGLVVLLPKGVGRHRLIGFIYVVAIVIVDIAALQVHEEAAFGVFHALAVVSLLTVAIGIVPLLLGSRSPLALSFHAYSMASSYAGLLAAGAGQVAATNADRWGSESVPITIGVALALSGVVIFLRVPPILNAVLPR